jgi:hypothetical protein
LDLAEDGMRELLRVVGEDDQEIRTALGLRDRRSDRQRHRSNLLLDESRLGRIQSDGVRADWIEPPHGGPFAIRDANLRT